MVVMWSKMEEVRYRDRQISRENGFDKLNFYHMFEMADYRGWQKFLDTLPDRDSYMQYIIVDVKARLIEKSE